MLRKLPRVNSLRQLTIQHKVTRNELEHEEIFRALKIEDIINKCIHHGTKTCKHFLLIWKLKM